MEASRKVGGDKRPRSGPPADNRNAPRDGRSHPSAQRDNRPAPRGERRSDGPPSRGGSQSAGAPRREGPRQNAPRSGFKNEPGRQDSGRSGFRQETPRPNSGGPRPGGPRPEAPRREAPRHEAPRQPARQDEAPAFGRPPRKETYTPRPSAPREERQTVFHPDEPTHEVIWGRRTVLEFLRSGSSINRLYVLTTGEGLPREFFEMAKQRNIPVVRSLRERLDNLTFQGNHQGVVAQVGAREFTEWDDMIEQSKARPEPMFLLALDGIQDPGNFGALLRTAEASGVHGVAISSQRSVGLTAAVSKASAGADAHLPISRLDRLDRAIQDLVESGVQVVATMPNAELLPYELDFTRPTVLVLGSEGSGIDPRVVRACSQRVRLPMQGKVESLNVSACGAILLYEVLRQRLLQAAEAE